MLFPILAGLGALCLSNPRRRKRRRKTNPQGKKHYRVFIGNSRHSPYVDVRAASEEEAFAEARRVDSLAALPQNRGKLTIFGTRKNPKRRGKGRKKLWRTVTTVTSSRVTKKMRINPVDRSGTWFPAKGVGYRLIITQRGKTFKSPKLWNTKAGAEQVARETRHDGAKPIHIRVVRERTNPDPRTAVTQRMPAIRATRPIPRDHDPRTATTQRLPAIRAMVKVNPKGLIGTAVDGTRYSMKKNSDTKEWMLVAYVNGKRHEGRTLYFEDKQDATNTFYFLMQQGRMMNPCRKKSRR